MAGLDFYFWSLNLLLSEVARMNRNLLREASSRFVSTSISLLWIMLWLNATLPWGTFQVVAFSGKARDTTYFTFNHF